MPKRSVGKRSGRAARRKSGAGGRKRKVPVVWSAKLPGASSDLNDAAKKRNKKRKSKMLTGRALGEAELIRDYHRITKQIAQLPSLLQFKDDPSGLAARKLELERERLSNEHH